MSIHRRIAFCQSMHDYRAERLPVAITLVSSIGKVNLSAVMTRAVQVARSLRAGGKGWTWRMSVALRTVWGWVKRDTAALSLRPALSRAA